MRESLILGGELRPVSLLRRRDWGQFHDAPESIPRGMVERRERCRCRLPGGGEKQGGAAPEIRKVSCIAPVVLVRNLELWGYY